MSPDANASVSNRVLRSTARDSGRTPAVLGVEPWSWPGDDNCGNMIHAAAARRIISEYVELKSKDEWTESQLDRLKSTHSHIVYVTANLIRIGVPRGHPSIQNLIASHACVAKNIEKAALPVVVFGLGSQASLHGPYEFRIAPETIRLLKVLSEHSRKIAVRGEFTADACARIGVKNVEVVGCQSLFWHRSPEFSWPLSEPVNDNRNFAFNFTDARMEAKLIQQAMVNGYDIIGQGNGGEEELRCGGGGTPASAPIELSWDVELAFAAGLLDRRQYEDWIRGHFFQFRRPQPWLDHMRSYRFSYGTRLHGNMAAMIAGTPALWIVHDMRTKEVCDHFRLPYVEISEVRNGVHLEGLLDRADFSRCMQIYPARYRVLYDYVNEAGLPHSLSAPIGCEEARISSRPIAEAAL
jgi:Polysaccharide pyruvyl transferase